MATLPMIYAVEETDDGSLAARIVAPGKAPDEVRDLLRIIRRSGGVERARERALAFHDRALAALTALPDRPERADFVVSRVR
jgi:geranylgeranyl pyrophosphate synthase